MPFAGFQGIVNGWIKINSKHVVVQNDLNREEAEASTGSGRSINLVRRLSHNKSHNGGRETESLALMMTPQSSSDTTPSADVTRTSNNQRSKSRRKLERTVSLTDLLREVAKEKQSEHHEKKGSTHTAQRKSGQKQAAPPRNDELSSDREAANMQSETDSDDGSFRFVAGFFGHDIPPPPPPPHSHPSHQAQHHHSEPLRQHKKAPIHPQARIVHGTNISDIVLHDASGQSRSSTSISAAQRSDDDHSDHKAQPASLRSTPPMHPTRSDDSKASKQSGTNNAMQQFFKGFPSSKRCGSCEEMENRVMAMQADMEYLRSASLRNEFVCRDCQNVRSRKDDSGRLIHASDRIAEMNTRHVEQVQQMTKERSRWQQDMHFKLSKFAMIAKDLNEESAMRKMDATKLEEELDQVKEERDGLALEVERLRAAAYQHEVQRIEHQMLKGALTEYETDCLCQAKEAILKRDNVIIELSSELERALEAIESGRAKQQQRRQIIFPARMSHPMPSHPQETITLKENLQQAKAEAASAKMKLEQSQQEAEAIILAYKSRVEELEGQIAESSAAMDSR